jgi:hypothetical protein
MHSPRKGALGTAVMNTMKPAEAAIARRQPQVRGDGARSWWLRLAVDRGG